MLHRGRRKTRASTIPIVFIGGGDPVEAGLVASLGRPGGNVTGISFIAVELTPKRLRLLLDLVPHARVIGFLVNQNSPTAERTVRNVQEAARAKGVQLPILKASGEGEFGDCLRLAHSTAWRGDPHALPIRCSRQRREGNSRCWPLAIGIPAIYAFRGVRQFRRPRQLRTEPNHYLSTGRHLCRSDLGGGQTD